MNKIDLQLFAEELLPHELDGISAETAKEIMDEVGEESTEETQVEETSEPSTQEEGKEETPAQEEKEEVETAPNAEADSDTKQVEGQGDNKIPYARFKEVNEEKKALEAKLAELKEQLNSQKPMPETPKQEVAKPVVDEENTLKEKKLLAEKIDVAATDRAAKILGLSKEEVDALEYSDDFVLKERFRTAKFIETQAILDRARALQHEEEAKKAEKETSYKTYISDLQGFINKEAAEIGNDEYNENLAYADGEYFKSCSLAEQQAVREANYRVNMKQPFPADVVILKNFYQNAKMARKSKLAPVTPTAQTKKVNIKEKIEQAKALPRTSQVTGGNDTSGNGNYTQEQLSHFMNDMDWDDVPEDAQNILMGK